MTELDDCLIIQVFGETDYTSFVYPKSTFEGREKIFGTPKADIFIRTVGALLGFDNWDELKAISREPLIGSKLVVHRHRQR
ncbi:hypothetical protein AYJ57_20615 (plasmid) [Salipiger sp. CCB-MM3]|uniref:hypothetical protein n=1 Tax=Salipiger sp. CCB-MM3 TaxID=1792508 RepID=UPI00080A95E4|nr:hypothetical protein [Salipiger sp. CCB-MM3]ANT62891.1 hypothetical protein AYJ57_20615 [Salipiger sp. CCB-MM3]